MLLDYENEIKELKIETDSEFLKLQEENKMMKEDLCSLGIKRWCQKGFKYYRENLINNKTPEHNAGKCEKNRIYALEYQSDEQRDKERETLCINISILEINFLFFKNEFREGTDCRLP